MIYCRDCKFCNQRAERLRLVEKNLFENRTGLASAEPQETITQLQREFNVNPLVSNCLASVAYAKQILADVEDARMAERPMDLNPPAWLLMHLATAADYAAMLLGGSGVCPADWNERADTKKPVSSNRSDYPSHDELVNHFESAYKNAADLLAKATPEQLSAPQKLGFFEKELPTVAEMAGFLLVAHLSIHLGQISAWRRATGKAPLF